MVLSSIHKERLNTLIKKISFKEEELQKDKKGYYEMIDAVVILYYPKNINKLCEEIDIMNRNINNKEYGYLTNHLLLYYSEISDLYKKLGDSNKSDKFFLLHDITNDKIVALYNEESHQEHSGMGFEEVAKKYIKLGDSINANKAYSRAMINYEKAEWYDDALRLAKKLNFNIRIEVYNELINIISSRNYDYKKDGKKIMMLSHKLLGDNLKNHFFK